MRACAILLLLLLISRVVGKRCGCQPGSQARLLERAGGMGGGVELAQRLGGVRFLRCGKDAARERVDLLDVGGKRADVADAAKCESSLTCWKPISASPLAMMLPTNTPVGVCLSLGLMASAMPMRWNTPIM